VVIGLLVTRRDSQQWNEQELQQINHIAQTIAIAGIWELRQRWYQGQLDEQQTLQLIERNRLDDFLHQLRNPLTALRTFTKLLLKKLLVEDKNYGIAESLLRESDRLQELIEEFDQQGEKVLPSPMIVPTVPLLSLPSALSREKSQLQKESFCLEEILQPLIISAEALAQDRGIKFTVEIPPHLPSIEANKKALREVLSNLIDNALKYTPSGGQVRIAIRYKENHQGIEIADTGYGIPREDQSRIFERHYRGVQSTGDIEGSGLGLAIAKELIDKMKGTIELISPNQLSNSQSSPGTTFTIWLPLASAAI
jgi:signal transduction histidine kinase